MVLKCKMCGGDLEVKEEKSTWVCEYCGTEQTIPVLQDSNIQSLFNRANVLRMKAEFDKAADIYEKILQVKGNESEAYWGLILCKYGIEYVEDPNTFKRVPTCHRTSFDAVISDDDYKMAIQYADETQRKIYEAEAKLIDEIQKGILALAQKESPYDIFICYKESDENGKRTPDSAIANDIYYQLTQEGFKVFYAAISLEDKLGQEYEPCIFSALNSSKVMLVLGTKPEYFNAVWVKNEWSRYLQIMKKDRSRMLIPCYRDMDAYELPEEFAHLQAQDMSRIGFINDVVRGIKKVVQKNSQIIDAGVKDSRSTVEKSGTNHSVANIGNIVALLKRGNMALEDGEWKKADEFYEEILNKDAENADAYLGKMLAELKIHSFSELEKNKIYFCDSKYLAKILRFGDKLLIENIKEVIYSQAISMMEAGTNDVGYEKCIGMFEVLGEYKDSLMHIEQCKEKVMHIKTAKTKTMRKIWVLSIAVALGVGLLLGFNAYRVNVLLPERQYKEANEALELREYARAIDLYTRLGDYKDSKQKIVECEEGNLRVAYDEAIVCISEEKYDEAINILTSISDFEDSGAQIERCNELIVQQEIEELCEATIDGEYKVVLSRLEEKYGKTSEQMSDIKTAWCKKMIEQDNQELLFKCAERLDYENQQEMYSNVIEQIKQSDVGEIDIQIINECADYLLHGYNQDYCEIADLFLKALVLEEREEVYEVVKQLVYAYEIDKAVQVLNMIDSEKAKNWANAIMPYKDIVGEYSGFAGVTDVYAAGHSTISIGVKIVLKGDIWTIVVNGFDVSLNNTVLSWNTKDERGSFDYASGEYIMYIKNGSHLYSTFSGYLKKKN